MSKANKQNGTGFASNKDLYDFYTNLGTKLTEGTVHRDVEKILTPERIARGLLNAARETPALLECDRMSLTNCVKTALRLGLEPAGPFQQFYLIPRRIGSEMVCTYIVSYRGIIDIARRCSNLVSIQAWAVYEKDKIEVQYGTGYRIAHTPYLDGPPGSIRGVHCRAVFKMGEQMISHQEYMRLDEIEAVKPKTKSDAWAKHYAEMAKKTVIRRASKMWPVALEMLDTDALSVLRGEDAQDDPIVVDAAPDATSAAPDARAQAMDNIARVLGSLDADAADADAADADADNH